MLCLRRFKNQSFTLHTSDGDIRIVVINITGERNEVVRLGIDAPLSVKITRPDMKQKYPRGDRMDSS